MKAAGKLVIGAILVIAGIYWYIAGNIPGLGISGAANLMALWTIFRGSIGVLVLLIGAFIVWLEADELKMEREMEEMEEDFDLDVEEETATEESKEEMDEVKEAVGGVEESEKTEESEGDYVCDECGKTFKSERGLKIHEGRKH